MPTLSVIIPVYNEEKTVKLIIEKIHTLSIDKEIIVVDDGSSDGTDKILRSLNNKDIKVIYHTSNRGKGSAVITGLTQATGEFIIIQDADMEYDPQDYFKLLESIKQTTADIVLGARFMKGYKGEFIHKLGNRFLTTLLNLMFGAHLNDCFTCYKLLRRQALINLNLSARGFDIEIEIVAKAIKNKLRIKEVPITYQPRSYAQGKKIRCRDGINAAASIFKYRFRD